MHTRSRPPALAIVLPHPTLSRRSSLLTPSPHTPARSQAFLFNSFPATSSPRTSSDSWASMISEENAVEAEWKPEQLALLSRSLDALPSHLYSPFRGPIPPPNVLDRIARGVLQATGQAEWPHSARATRSKLAYLAREAAREAARENAEYARVNELTLYEADEMQLDDGADADRRMYDEATEFQMAAELGRNRAGNAQRPIYRQSAMDFLPENMDSNLDRLSTRLRRTDRIITSTSFHPYARPTNISHSPTSPVLSISINETTGPHNGLDSPISTSSPILGHRLSSTSLNYSRIPTLRRVLSFASNPSSGHSSRPNSTLSYSSVPAYPKPLGRTASETTRPSRVPAKISRSESLNAPPNPIKRAPSFSRNIKRAPSFGESGPVSLSSMRDNIQAAAARDSEMRNFIKDGPASELKSGAERKRKTTIDKCKKEIEVGKVVKKSADIENIIPGPETDDDTPRRSKRLKRTNSLLDVKEKPQKTTVADNTSPKERVRAYSCTSPTKEKDKTSPAKHRELAGPALEKSKSSKERSSSSSSSDRPSSSSSSNKDRKPTKEGLSRDRERTSSSSSKSTITSKTKDRSTPASSIVRGKHSSSNTLASSTSKSSTRTRRHGHKDRFGPELPPPLPVSIKLEIPRQSAVSVAISDSGSSTSTPLTATPIAQTFLGTSTLLRTSPTSMDFSADGAHPPPTPQVARPKTLRRIGVTNFPRGPSRKLSFGVLYDPGERS